MVSVAEALSVVSRLLAREPEVREAAFATLCSWGELSFDNEVVEVLLAAAEGTYPLVSEAVPATPNAALVSVLWHDARNIEPDVVARYLPRMGADARWATVQLLAANSLPKAAVLLGRELRRIAAEETTPMPDHPVLLPLHSRPADADILAAGLLALLHNPLWMCASAGVLQAFALDGVLDRLYSLEVADVLRPRVIYELDALRLEWDTHGPAVRWDDRRDYSDRRATTGLLLNLLGCLRRVDSSTILDAALRHPDPWIAMSAATALLGTGHVPPSSVLVRVASDAECRVPLVKTLEAAGRVDLLPVALRTQAVLAEAEMVQWLIYPTELGRPPDEIEPVGVQPMRHAEGVADLYVFRFRTHEPHWAAEQGWLVGVAGPYLRSAQPTSHSLNATFSRFEAYDPGRVHESIRSIIETLTDGPSPGGPRPGGPAPWRPFRRRRS